MLSAHASFDRSGSTVCCTGNTKYVKGEIKMLKKRSKGLEMVEVAILIAVVVALGLIFKTQLTNLVNSIFRKINEQAGRI